MAEGMRAALGQPVIVENVTGAGGTTGGGIMPYCAICVVVKIHYDAKKAKYVAKDTKVGFKRLATRRQRALARDV